MDNKERAIRIALGIKENVTADHNGEPSDEDIAYIEKITAYTILAHCLGLKHIYGNVYADEHDHRYVQTKFGFQPEDSFNKGIIIRELKKQVKELESELKDKNYDMLELSGKLESAPKAEVADENEQLKEAVKKQGKYINELRELLAANEAKRAALLITHNRLKYRFERLNEGLSINTLAPDIDEENKNLRIEVAKLKSILDKIVIHKDDRRLLGLLHGIEIALDRVKTGPNLKLSMIRGYIQSIKKLEWNEEEFQQRGKIWDHGKGVVQQ